MASDGDEFDVVAARRAVACLTAAVVHVHEQNADTTGTTFAALLSDDDGVALPIGEVYTTFASLAGLAALAVDMLAESYDVPPEVVLGLMGDAFAR